MPAEFIHLRVHSAYSLLEGALKVPQIIDLACSHKMPAVAITDTNNMFGALEFATAAAKKGIQPLIGIQINLPTPGLVSDGLGTQTPVVFLAQNQKGYQNLMRFSSQVYKDLPQRGSVFAKIDDLHLYSEGILCLTGGAQGPLGALLLRRKNKEALRLLEILKSLFQGRLYMEIQRHGLDIEDKTEPFFIEQAFKQNIPLVATNNCYFATSSMYEAHDALLCVADGTYVNESKRRRETPHHYFKSAKEMADLFLDLPEAIQNTMRIMQRCAFMPEPSKPLLPPFESDSKRPEVEELKHQAEEGLKNRLAQKKITDPEIKKEYYDRLSYELDVIIQMGFQGYFLIVSDFIKWAKSRDIPVGPGRGSGAGSLVAWSLLITDIDPIQFGLIFERFLNPERVSMPDFDVDFCQDRRDEVIQYVQQRYGSEKVAHIITFGTLQARAVLRDVGRVLQMPYTQVDRICKLVPFNPASPCTLQEAIDQEPLLQAMHKDDESVTKLVDIALKLEGLYRHASTHAAGLIIGDRPLQDLVPLYRDPKSDILATQFSMKYAEMAGLVKFDFLGLKTLTILQKSAKLASEATGQTIDLTLLPLDDEKTFDLLCRLETVGIFQLEGQGMRDVLRRLQPRHFEDIIDINALYRPGPMESIPRYISCKHGKEEVSYLHPALEPILKKTHGVMVYQEQVMEIARVLGGYTFGGADLLRRAMGKKIKSEMNAQKEVFVKGAMARGIDLPVALEIFNQMAKFSGYGFNKSHSAPYALVSYQTAYMKANYPHEFMAATMTYDMHNTDKLEVYHRELKLMGIALLPPDVNHSEDVFSVALCPKTNKKAIRYGLAAVKNVGAQAMLDLVENRRAQGPFKSIEDFVKRLNSAVLNKRQLEHLVMSGALDSLYQNRGALFAAIEEMVRFGSLVDQEAKSTQGGLFDGSDQTIDTFKIPDMPDWDMMQKLEKEMEAIGFYLTAHPLSLYDAQFYKDMRLTRSCDIHQTAASLLTLIGLPMSLKVKTSKRGKKFAFAAFSDAFGSYELVVFSDYLDIVRAAIAKGEAVWIKANVKRDDQGDARLAIMDIGNLEEKVGDLFTNITLNVSSLETLVHIKSFLEKVPKGDVSVRIHLKKDGRVLDVVLPDTYQLTPADRTHLFSIVQAQPVA